jgi:type VI secretion system protein ImpC
LDVEPDAAPARTADPGQPFRILALGDFSARAHRQEPAPLAGRRLLRVDCDNFDETLSALAPELHLPRAALRFASLDDFHPDALYSRAPVFVELAHLRSTPPKPTASAPAAPPASGLLDSIVDQTESAPGGMGTQRNGAPADPLAEAADLRAFLDRALAPHLAERADPKREAWAARVDEVAASEMRALLGHPWFQNLEALWRAARLLIDRLQPDAELHLYLFDATREELLAEPDALARLLDEDGQPWGAIAANFRFGQTAADAERLARFGHVARQVGATFLAEAEPPDEHTAHEWDEFRHSPAARWVGLALPRFLLRLPYGRKTSAIEAFDFEEMPESVHRAYLWGNPAFACACLLGLLFRRDGWRMRPGANLRLEGLPLHLYTEAGETAAKPCAELLLSEDQAWSLLDNGFMPLASLKDQDAALLVRFESVADPPGGLAGPWS